MAASDPRSSISSDATMAGLDFGHEDDLEAQKLLGSNSTSVTDTNEELGTQSPSPAAALGYEYGVSARVKLTFLILYLCLNMGLTLHSKSILEQIHAPWSLTTLHATFSSLGCGVLYLTGFLKLTRLSTRENLVLLAFSFLFTINIAVSVVSLSMVSVPFHQTVRASTPLFTVAAYRFLFGREYSFWTQVSLVPIFLGVAAATYGDMDFTTAGLILTFAGVILATAKTITTNRILTGSLKLPALELLFRLSPLAALQACTFAMIAGEGKVMHSMVVNNQISTNMILALIANGCIALLLNITSFQTNKLAGALTLTVSANVKQCLTILLGIVLFHVKINWVNGVGMAVTAAGAAWFSSVELMAKQQQKAELTPAPTLQLPILEKEKETAPLS